MIDFRKRGIVSTLGPQVSHTLEAVSRQRDNAHGNSVQKTSDNFAILVLPTVVTHVEETGNVGT
jgi:hypothetical protein